MDTKSSLRRKEFLKILGVSIVGMLLPGTSQTKPYNPDKKPNILVILVDDLGYGDLSSYGAKDLRTPNIDQLMANGMRFDNFYANCPVCSPTRASLMTGRYPDMVGVPGVIRTHPTNNFGYLSPDAVMLPTMLKKAGYHTAIIGKWHLGLESPNIPNERGFDHFHGFLGDMMDDYYTHLRHGYNYMRLNKQEIHPEGHATDLFTQWAIEYIRGRINKKQPFFLYLAYNAPHTPIQPPEEWLEKVKKREKGIDSKRAKIVALIEHLDYSIGKVIQALKDAGLYKNTQNMFEGGIRVPTCFVWPGKIEAGTRNNKVALTMDLFPTLCAVAGVEITHEIDGKNILPDLFSRGKIKADEERTLFWVRREGNRYGGRAYYAVRKGNWKLLQNSPFEPYQLYNLKDDPGEQHPLPKDHPKYKELFNELKNHIIKAGAVPWQKYPVKL